MFYARSIKSITTCLL